MKEIRKYFMVRLLWYGLAMGSTFYLYTMTVFLFKLDKDNLDLGIYFDRFVIIIPILFTFFGIRSISKQTGFSYWRGLKSGLFINFTSFLIYTPFLLIYHHFINPEWLEYLLKFKEAELIASNESSETIKITIEQIRKSSTDMNHLISGLIYGVLIIGSILSLISAFILKRIK